MRLPGNDDPRVTVRRGGPPDPAGQCVVYWMQRAQRAVDNPALETAAAVANELGMPLVVFFRLVPGVRGANLRHYQFLVEGLPEVAEELARRRIGFVLRCGREERVASFCAEVRAALVVSDEDPLRDAEAGRRRFAHEVSVPFWTVDADLIVPSRLLEREQYAARTIRPRIHRQLERFLVSVRTLELRVPWCPERPPASRAPTRELLAEIPLDRTVSPVAGFRGGTGAALERLKLFANRRLASYADDRNHPELDGTSQLSPYMHFGQISIHRVALTVRDSAVSSRQRDAFLEELIVRRELAVNFVRYNPRYDRLASAEPWALKTLREHAGDERRYRYGERELENAETHDPLWNAAQKQMVLTGWMHGYVRMYWAKKILEWSPSAEEAYDVAVRLNDRYELDGRDPNGYTGIAWAIGGKHDRAWGPERPVYGKIRYMSFDSTSRKFDSRRYMETIGRLERGGVPKE
jgi:deoxyribodipyrimidine photo-lyase